MTIIRTVVHHRRIEVPASDDMADGTEVVVELTPVTETIGIDESDWDDSPEGIEALIQRYNALEPFIFSDQELADMEAERLARKQWEKKHFIEYSDKLAKQWE